MSTIGIFNIFDSKANTYTVPSYSINIETARREFQTTINKKGAGYLYEYAEDYTLFYLGEYDQDTGTMVLEQAPKSVINALQLKDQSVVPDMVGQMREALKVPGTSAQQFIEDNFIRTEKGS